MYDFGSAIIIQSRALIINIQTVVIIFSTVKTEEELVSDERPDNAVIDKIIGIIVLVAAILVLLGVTAAESRSEPVQKSIRGNHESVIRIRHRIVIVHFFDIGP